MLGTGVFLLLLASVDYLNLYCDLLTVQKCFLKRLIFVINILKID